MDFKAMLSSGKRARLDARLTEFGTVEEIEGDFYHLTGTPENPKDPVKIKHTEIMLGDWEIERLPRIFYLGITKIQSHMNVREIMQAVESRDGNPPPGKPMDGASWVKVIEVIE
jgi:hypothetical protein